ncbi:MAG: hypothetical protein EBS06_06840 [Proteobacteria bacterium]|nr:hypothetical protein [Pseudomonadota bacterium]
MVFSLIRFFFLDFFFLVFCSLPSSASQPSIFTKLVSARTSLESFIALHFFGDFLRGFLSFFTFCDFFFFIFFFDFFFFGFFFFSANFDL